MSRYFLNLILIFIITLISYQLIYKYFLFKTDRETIKYFTVKLNSNYNIKNIETLKIENVNLNTFNVIVSYQYNDRFCTDEIKIIYKNSTWIGKKKKIKKC